MSEFDDARAALDEARTAAAETKSGLSNTRQRKAKIDREIERLARTANDATGASSRKRIEVLHRESASLDADIAGLQSAAGKAASTRDERLKAFNAFSDPIKGMERLADSYPIALFPLRIEIRFKAVQAGEATRHQLWVRVFPDDALVDTFQPDLSDAEIKNARIYWTQIWRAGGVVAERKAAWAGLAKSSGGGRAKWIVDTYAPLNPGDEPVKADGDHVLVVVPDAPVPPGERSAIAAYWEAVWRSAGTDGAAALITLEGAVGAARAAEIVGTLAPANLTDIAVKPADATNVIVAFLDLPPPATTASAEAAWSRGARSWLLPERLVLLGFNGRTETLHQVGKPIPSELQVGPDPSAPESEQLKADGEDLVIPDGMRWTIDFQQAVDVGMGFVADLTPAQARTGFDRLFVLGVRLASDETKGAAEVATLFADHQRSRKGLALLPQGTPTNNTDEASSGYTWWEDPAVTYRHFFEIDHSDDPDDWRVRKDGAWLAGMLGIDREVMQAAPGYFGTDQTEARAMNTALWPATLGYFMEQMMDFVFSDETITATRGFFNRYVIGRGTTPAIRIGRQPYGILPTTVYSRMNWFAREDYALAVRKGLAPDVKYMTGLRTLIERAVTMWDTIAGDVAFVGDGAPDPQKTLLEIIGLHPTSAEFYQRYAESLEQLYNRLKFSIFRVTTSAQEVARRYVESGLNVLAQFGWSRGTLPPPQILDKFFLRRPSLLKGILVDTDVSEKAGLTVARGDGDNYLAWLQKASRTSHDALRKQEGFDDAPPSALLYLMLHHALDLGYIETSYFLRANAALLDADSIRAARKEPKFLHVAAAASDSTSRWADLYSVAPAITGNTNQRLGDFIPTIIESMSPYLKTQLDALDVLKTATSAALERAFVEHIDCSSYRLDAWRSGLVTCQLSFMRGDADGALSKPGLFVGAYGWLEDIRPKPTSPDPVTLDDQLAAVFQKDGDTQLLKDPTNRGHIHAPSLDHAVTAAILRNGYLANATPANPETLAVNLTSERVRLAMNVIEGIRNGQPLGALLGYQLERSLHDSADLFLDRLIFGLRRAFPLAGNRIKSTEAPDAEITAVEARNVVDGLAFIQHLEKAGNRTYPYDVPNLPALADLTDTTAMTAAQIGAAIDARVDRMRNINDAVADLAMAEGVYQVVKGNYDRAAGTLDAFSKGNFPPTPEVAVTPRSGKMLVHRVGLHLEGGLDPADPANLTPRAKGEPALNCWLTRHLPSMAEVFAAVEYFDNATATTRRLTASMADLGLEPIDLFYLVDEGSARDMAGLDDLLLYYAASRATPPRADAVFTLLYKPDGVPGLTVFEVAPLIRSLRGVILGSRPLKASDVMLANEANAAADASAIPRPDKVAAVIAGLQAELAAIRAVATALDSAVGEGADPVAAKAAALANIDQWSADYAGALRAIAPFGLRAASLTTPTEQARPQFASLLVAISALVTRWEGKLQDYTDTIIAYDGLPNATPDEERFPLLIRAGRIISTEVITPLPPTANDMRMNTLPPMLAAFENALGALRNLLAGASKLGAFFMAVGAFSSTVADHDQAPLELDNYADAIVGIAKDLAAKSALAVADIDARLDKANTILATVPAAPAGKQQALVADAMHAVLGEAFIVLPEFVLAPDRLAEWQNAWGARGGLLTHLTTGADPIPFPVDDWLHGLGRVRDKLRNFEMAGLLGEAMAAPDGLDLTPVQFPFRPDDAWLGLKFPATMPDGSPFVIEGDRLLYTAHFGENAEIAPADPARSYCGFLIDEWSELIPAEEENTGLAFHYDRPSAEAPQAILLATPPQFTGAWKWADLVDTLHETLDFARLRAVEPSQIDTSDLSRFLPAVVSAVTMFPITAMLNFSQNNALATRLEAGNE